MPKFAPGELKTAVAPIIVRPTGLNCETELYLVSNGAKAATAGVKSFISTGARQDIAFPITMPAPGTYPVYLDVAAQGMLIGAYKAIEDVIVAGVPAVEIVKAYIRMQYPSVSAAYSGWISITPVGSELNLAQFGSMIQAGVLLRNPTQSPLRYTCTIYNYHWIEPNNYTTDYLTLPGVEPKKISYYVCGICGSPFYLYDHYVENGVCPYCGAISGPTMGGNPPTGLPYSGYQYECDMFLPPGGELPPGKTGFVYTELYYQSRRWNNVYIEIKSNGYDLGTTKLYGGWYSY